MPLVDTLPYGEQSRQDPPTRLDLDGIVLPSDVDLTLVGTIHDGSCSEADYASEIFNTHYAVLMESYDWGDAERKRFQRISRGYSNAMEDNRALNEAAIRTGSEFRRKNALWNISMSEALYKSGVRVIMADVSHEDITDGKATDFAKYAKAVGDVMGRGVMGLPISEEDLVLFSERDSAIVKAICEGIDELRRQDPKLNREETLKAVGLYGVVHTPTIADALTALAADQDTDSFTVSTRYEVAVPNPREGIDSLELEDRQMRTAGMIKFYSDWLRTEPVERDTLWYPDIDVSR